MESIFRFLLMPIVWIPIVVILIVLTVRNYRKANRLQVLNVDSVLLMMEIPKDNDKKEALAVLAKMATLYDADNVMGKQVRELQQKIEDL